MGPNTCLVKTSALSIQTNLLCNTISRTIIIVKLRKYESRFVTNAIDENSTPDVICQGICDLFTVLAMTERGFLLSTQKWNCNSESVPLSRLYCVRNAPLRWLLICDLFASPLTPLTTHLSPSLTLLLNIPTYTILSLPIANELRVQLLGLHF